MKLEAFRQKDKSKYIAINLFTVIIPLLNLLITVQRFHVIWMFRLQRNFSIGAVHSAD